jgi:hypothetical protein
MVILRDQEAIQWMKGKYNISDWDSSPSATSFY